MDYVRRTVTVLESGGVAQLTVNISMPSEAVPNEMCFGLLVNTSDETAIGLKFTIDFMYPYSLWVYSNRWNIKLLMFPVREIITNCRA